eukprot:5051253-Prymnesium_polylepis.1
MVGRYCTHATSLRHTGGGARRPRPGQRGAVELEVVQYHCRALWSCILLRRRRRGPHDQSQLEPAVGWTRRSFPSEGGTGYDDF